MVVYDFNPNTRRQRQVELCEFQASLDYIKFQGRQGHREIKNKGRTAGRRVYKQLTNFGKNLGAGLERWLSR